MSLRAQDLHVAFDRQIAELAALLAVADPASLARPCPGRGKLGDGTIGALAALTTDNFLRVARFVAGIRDDGELHQPGGHGDGFLASELDLDSLRARLGTARHSLAAITQLGDEQLDSLPPAGEMKFANGERTLEQILASVLKHQRHQVDALAAALS